jgi:hypothetical protein
MQLQINARLFYSFILCLLENSFTAKIIWGLKMELLANSTSKIMCKMAEVA